MILGQNGDIALYVTDVTPPSDKVSVPENYILDSEWGSLLKYIPSEQIKSLTFRLKKKS